ncbi:MAG TPA: heparinase II/III family protein, partial [Gemmatimonadaceae bacterium]|nr:heparinase II/III family protein [Gemmatimonadaceae bacterium]
PGESVFNWQSVPQSRATAWVTTPIFDFFKGEHDGFRRLASPAMHSRAVFLVKGEYVVVHDRIRGAGEHRGALWLHWAPGSTVSHENQNILNVQLAEPNAPRITAIIHAHGGDLSSEEGWVSPAYAVRAPAPVSVLRLDTSGSEDIVTVVASSASCQRLVESAFTPGSGSDAGVLTLELDASVDTILSGPASDSTHNEIVSDAGWTWVRRSPTGELLAFAIVGGSALTIGGCPLFHSDSIVDCAIGRRDGDGWRIELESPDRPSIISRLSTTSGIEEPCAASVE